MFNLETHPTQSMYTFDSIKIGFSLEECVQSRVFRLGSSTLILPSRKFRYDPINDNNFVFLLIRV